MGFKQLIAGVLIGTVSCGTFAKSEWENIGYKNGVIGQIKKSSIRKVTEYPYQNYFKVWIKTIIQKDLIQDGLSVGDYQLALVWVDCNARTLGIKSITTYKKHNNIFNNETYTYPSVPMEDAVPDTGQENIVKVVCL